MELPDSITQDTLLQPGVYYAPDGIVIGADGVTLDGGGALLVGADRRGAGVTVRGRDGVTVKNLRISEYYHGIVAEGCAGLTVAGCQVTTTAEVAPNTIFLDVWLPREQAYGGGILLDRCSGAQIVENDLQHQMSGLLCYRSSGLTVRGNNASYNSGWGFLLSETCDSLFEGNYADYCCRYEPRGERIGHMGADAAGFLIIRSSSRNRFRRNMARLGGDGFFLAGLAPAASGAGFDPVPCNNNRFEENDASYSPNIAFEATFSSGNEFINNNASACNYGFWLGFSHDGLIDGNQVHGCRQAGIATEMGYNFRVVRNVFSGCGHGILLWSKHIPELVDAVPENNNSYGWQIEANTFERNNIAVRIAANQDHGIRPYPVPRGEDPTRFCRPHHHTIRRNTFRENRLNIETVHADETAVIDNIFAGK